MSYKYNYEKCNNHTLFKVIKPVASIVVRNKFKVNYIGAENVPKDRGIIIASNHILNLDPVIISLGCNVELHFMAKKELFENKISGWFLENLNAFPVNRSKFDFDSVNHAIKLLKNGGVLGIFPEGTRSSDFKPHNAKGGICYIAKEAKCDVVPVSIYTCDNAKSGTRLTVRYGKPIKYEELKFDEECKKMKDLRHASNLIMGRIAELWEEGHEN